MLSATKSSLVSAQLHVPLFLCFRHVNAYVNTYSPPPARYAGSGDMCLLPLRNLSYIGRYSSFWQIIFKNLIHECYIYFNLAPPSISSLLHLFFIFLLLHVYACICIYMYIWVCAYTCIYNLLSEFSVICVCLCPRLRPGV